MCREQSRQQRTIATSRGDDNRDESSNERHRQRSTIKQGHEIGKNRQPRLAQPVRKKLGENRLSLTNSFRKGHIVQRKQANIGYSLRSGTPK